MKKYKEKEFNNIIHEHNKIVEHLGQEISYLNEYIKFLDDQVYYLKHENKEKDEEIKVLKNKLLNYR